MANEQNLIPQAHVLTVEEASRGGKKSAESRAAKKTFREGLLFLLNEPIKKNGKETGKNHQDAVIAGLVKRAASGDPKAIALLLDIIGETPDRKTGGDVEDLTPLKELLK